MNAQPEHPTADDATAMADLIDLVLGVAREIRYAPALDASLVRLTMAEGNVMRFVDRNPGASAGEVAAGTALRPSNLSTAFRALEAHGMIERRTEGRSVTVWPTERAASNLRGLRREWASRVADILGDDTADLTAAIALLSRLDRGLVANR